MSKMIEMLTMKINELRFISKLNLSETEHESLEENCKLTLILSK